MGIYYFGIIFYGFYTANTNFVEVIEMLPSDDWIRKYINGGIILDPNFGWSIDPNLIKDIEGKLVKSDILKILDKDDSQIMEVNENNIEILHKIAKKMNISVNKVGLYYLNEFMTTFDGIHNYINYIIPIL